MGWGLTRPTRVGLRDYTVIVPSAGPPRRAPGPVLVSEAVGNREAGRGGDGGRPGGRYGHTLPPAVLVLAGFLFAIGLILWLVFGFWIKSAPVILTNAVSLAFALTIFVLKIRYDGLKRGKAKQ